MISLIVSSYNGAGYLKYSLHSLLKIKSPVPFEVLFVDNNSTDGSKEVVKNLVLNYPSIDFRYVLEINQGVSYARNRGIKEAKFDQIVLLDDDIIVEPDFVDNIKNHFETMCFDCFSGCIYSHFLDTKPKWMSELYESNCIYGINEHTEIWGALVAFNKQKIDQRFDPDLGPKENLPAYGDDSVFINNLKTKGFSTGVVSGLSVGHIVERDKYSLRWNLKNQIRKGRSNIEIVGAEKSNQTLLFKIISNLIKSIFKSPLTFIKNGFSIKGVVYSILEKPLMDFGKLISKPFKQ